MDSSEQEKYDLLLETLSFYEPMSLEKIIIDIDAVKAKKISNFNKEALEVALNHLIEQKLIKQISVNKQKTWIRGFKRKRPWWKRLFWFFKY